MCQAVRFTRIQIGNSEFALGLSAAVQHRKWNDSNCPNISHLVSAPNILFTVIRRRIKLVEQISDERSKLKEIGDNEPKPNGTS
jgi:hypothetical protein